MICPHCLDEADREAQVWSYDDDHVTCKFGHIQRAANALESVPAPEPTPPEQRRPVPPVAVAAASGALGAAAIEILTRLL